MKLLRAADHRRMPWKNGGGETLEVAVSPPDAGIADFDWRISMAIVAVDGGFSAFPGVDRTLVVLDGHGMTLDIAGRGRVLLTQGSAPCVFPGDVAVSVTLTRGPITDLNAMTARGRYTHGVERFGEPRALLPGASETLLLSGDGAIIEAGGARVTLHRRDVMRIEAGETAHVTPAAGPGFVSVTIRPAG